MPDDPASGRQTRIETSEAGVRPLGHRVQRTEDKYLVRKFGQGGPKSEDSALTRLDLQIPLHPRVRRANYPFRDRRGLVGEQDLALASALNQPQGNRPQPERALAAIRDGVIRGKNYRAIGQFVVRAIQRRMPAMPKNVEELEFDDRADSAEQQRDINQNSGNVLSGFPGGKHRSPNRGGFHPSTLRKSILILHRRLSFGHHTRPFHPNLVEKC